RKVVNGEPLLDWLWRGRVEKWLLAFFAVGVFSAAVANPLEPNSARSLFRLASFLLFYYTITGWTKKESQLRNLCMALFLSTIGVCALGLAQVAGDGFGDWYYALHAAEAEMAPPWQGRIASVFLGVNSLAAHLNMVIPLAVAAEHLPTTDYYLRFSAKLCFILGVITLVLTQSRGGYLAFAFVVLTLIMTVLRRSTRRGNFYLTLLVSAVAGLALVFLTLRSTDTGSAIASERFGSADEVTMQRLVMFGAALTMFAGSPIFGIGYGNFRAHFNSFIGDLPNDIWDTHNLYLKFLAEIGLVGFLVFCGLTVSLMKMARQSWREGSYPLERICAVGLVGGVVSVLVQGFVEALIENPQFGSMLWFLFAIFVVSRRLGRTEMRTMGNSAV
ncbi:MAG TPA: O-antigen ligase family protein, partial [Candidatus Angelobacter sp.]|nr:O-antigen ligase family protein [Candidatus Angelobacter sp.]